MKKSMKLIVSIAVIVLSACIALGGCDKTLESLAAEGIKIVGGGFDSGTVLSFLKVTDEETVEEVKTAISELGYDGESDLYIYDISALKDGAKVQPDGKVQVTLDAPSSDITDYLVYHIKDSGSAEKLQSTYSSGKILFETESFSYFAVTEESYTFQAFVGSQGGLIYKDNEAVANGFYGKLESGKTVKLTAVPDEGCKFDGWYKGDATSVGEEMISSVAEYTFTIPEADSIVYAMFSEKPFVGFEAIAGDNGTISENGEIIEGSYGQEYQSGTSVTLTATPCENYAFKGWFVNQEDMNYDNAISTSATYTFVTTEEEMNVIAIFYRTSITFSAVGNNGVSIIIDGEKIGPNYEETIAVGESITVTAEVEEGYKFIGWYANQVKVSEELSYTCTAGEEDVWIFAETEETVTELILDSANAGFTEGVAEYVIGGEYQPNIQMVLVSGKKISETNYLELNKDYTIDNGGLNFEVAGIYTITYTYTADNSIKATLTVKVLAE